MMESPSQLSFREFKWLKERKQQVEMVFIGVQGQREEKL